MQMPYCSTLLCLIIAVLVARGSMALGLWARKKMLGGSMGRSRQHEPMQGTEMVALRLASRSSARCAAPQMFVQLGNLRGEDGDVPPLSLTNDVDLVTLYRALSAPPEAT